MKILLVGEYYSTNLGDPLLCRTVQYAIEREYPRARVVPFDISGKISYSEHYDAKKYPAAQLWYFRAKNRFPKLWRKNNLYQIIAKDEARHMRVAAMLEEMLNMHTFDLVVFAGGSLFMDYFAGVIYLMLKRLVRTDAKILFHACGMSSLSSDSEQLLKRILTHKRIYSITMRDSYTRFCAMFQTKAQVDETFDTALASSCFFEGVCEQKAEYGVGIMAIPEYYVFQKALVEQLLKSEKKWKLFTNGNCEDQSVAERILKDLGIAGEKQGQWLMPRPANPEDLVKVVTSFEKIISFRMHSQIVAASYGIPCYGFVWDKKVEEMYEKLDLAQCCEKPKGVPNLYEIDRILEAVTGIKEKAHVCGQKSINDLYTNVNHHRNNK